MDINPEVEYQIAKNVPWIQLPNKVKEMLGRSQKGYERAILAYSIRNQLRYSDNLVKTIRKDESNYYNDIVQYSKEHLMLFPYHLSDRIVKGLRITPFEFYLSILERIMDQDKSYDSLPNFTAADCLRLLGIGRNQYIELMNQHRSSRKYFRRKPPKDYLPTKPMPIIIEPWYIVQIGYITESDMGLVNVNEKQLIDFLIDNGGQKAGELDFDCVHSLYVKGLIYLDVPVLDDDYIIVPPLEGFVMNRLLGDYFETLLYKIFVSLDEHTRVIELATVLDIDGQLIKNAISVYCRLGFAYKKNLELDYSELHSTWKKYSAAQRSRGSTYIAPDESLIADELCSAMNESESDSNKDSSESTNHSNPPPPPPPPQTQSFLTSSQSMSSINVSAKRIALLYDSTLTAYLMMGNLSPGLKNHAVTMFEVGKMSDESLDSFLTELEQIAWNEGEGEAQRYFEHAKTLKKSILFLRNNSKLGSLSLDLLRCESLLNLDSGSCERLLMKNYAVLIAMAPISHEVKPVYCPSLPYFGPIPHVNSIWFKLFLYSKIGTGPASLFLSRGTILRELPPELEDCNKYLVTSWGHDPGVIPGINALFTLNDALCHSAVLVQEYGENAESSTVVVPFPLENRQLINTDSGQSTPPSTQWAKHPAIQKLSQILDLENNFGYITMMNKKGKSSSSTCVRNSKLENLPEEEPPRPSDSSALPVETAEDFTSEQDPTPTRAPSDPKNGFKDASCAKLLSEELDSLLGGSPIQQPPTYDPRQQKIENLRLDLNMAAVPDNININIGHHEGGNEVFQDQSFGFDDWLVLDCHFGLPLFDSGVNAIVTERIVRNGLWDEENLEQVVKSTEGLATELNEFISKCQESSLEDSKDETPLPYRNFYFRNGGLQQLT